MSKAKELLLKFSESKRYRLSDIKRIRVSNIQGGKSDNPLYTRSGFPSVTSLENEIKDFYGLTITGVNKSGDKRDADTDTPSRGYQPLKSITLSLDVEMKDGEVVGLIGLKYSASAYMDLGDVIDQALVDHSHGK